MARTGRPKIEIDAEQFKKLCGLQCSLAEIAGFFNCCEDTVENWCKRELKENFSEAYKKYSAAGKTSLRRYQFALAKKSAAMAIFLGKNILGQRDAAPEGQGQANNGILDDLAEYLKPKPETEAKHDAQS